MSRVVLSRRSKPALWRNYHAALYIRAEPRTPPAIRTICNNRVPTQAHQVEVGVFAPQVLLDCPIEISNNRRAIRQLEIRFAPLRIIRENKEYRVGHLGRYQRGSLAVVLHRQDPVIGIPYIIGASHVDEYRSFAGVQDRRLGCDPPSREWLRASQVLPRIFPQSKKNTSTPPKNHTRTRFRLHFPKSHMVQYAPFPYVAHP